MSCVYKVRIYAINPKSITMGQLYGETDLQSGEWTDGIASVMVRHCSNPDTEETGVTSRGRHCRSAATPSHFSRSLNRDGERVSAD